MEGDKEERSLLHPENDQVKGDTIGGERALDLFSIQTLKFQVSVSLQDIGGSEAPAPHTSRQSVILRGGFSAVQATHFRPDVSKKGMQLVDHVLRVEEERTPDGLVVFRGECIRGTKIRERPCKIELSFSSARKFISGHCTCRAGIDAQCKHAAAVFHFINQERALSCTDREQRWHKPSKRLEELYPKCESLEKLTKGVESPQVTFSENEDKLQEFAAQLKGAGMTSASLYKTITAKPREEEEVNVGRGQLQPLAQKLLSSSLCLHIPSAEFQLTDRESEFFRNSVSPPPSRTDIFLRTMGQAKNPAWFAERKTRITASTAHKIVRAKTTKTRASYFQKAPLDLPSLRYGRAAEDRAKKRYEEATGRKIEECGLIVHEEKSWLCGTPDGLVEEEDGSLILLEIKCPFSCMDKEINVRYIQENELCKSHEYYTQIQCQLFVANVSKCHLFVFSDKDSKLLSISRDDPFL